MSDTIRVVAAIIKREEKYLITRRAPSKHLAGFWEFPGGKIEEGETAEECLIREVKEELDIVIRVNSFFMENEHSYPSKSIILFAFLCEMEEGQISLKDHDSFVWADKSQLAGFNFAPADIPFVEKLQNS
jgi:8-oxo-dGTP diphosphatase